MEYFRDFQGLYTSLNVLTASIYWTDSFSYPFGLYIFKAI